MASEPSCTADTSQKKFACQVEGCLKMYSRGDSLKNHLQHDHLMDDVVKQGRFECDNCMKKFYHASKLVKHCEEEHDMHIAVEKKEFPGWLDFQSWKEEEEAQTYSCFVQVNGEVTGSEEKTGGTTRSVVYVCCRDGCKRRTLTNRHNKTGQTRKHVNTRKLGTFCISRIMATEYLQNGNVKIVYISSHTNHILGIKECKHLPLPQSVKGYIQQRFAAGVSLERILDDIRGGIGSRINRTGFVNAASRKHFVTRQDSRNACRKLHEFTNHRHIDDAISVDRIVKELQKESPPPVLFYKPQGAVSTEFSMLAADTFLLVLMTSFQAEIFEEFCSKITCVDSTHKTNEYRFKLITIVVPDECCNGQPVVWAISDREDTPTLEVVWTVVKRRCPKANVTALMSDDDLAGVLACSHVYNGVRHILCRWHVDRAWQRKLRSVVKSKDHQAELYACLWMLISEQDEKIFLQNQETFLSYWQKEEPEFVTYYRNEYLERQEKWAMCYRHFDHSCTDTNMLVESFHNKLKTNPRYLNKLSNRRCDDLIQVLLKIEEDMFHDRMRKEVMCRAKDASLTLEGEQRHSNGKEIPESIVTMISDSEYRIGSAGEECTYYTVLILSANCPQEPDCIPQCCELQCGYLCRHMVQCTCLDYVHGHLCKHAHKVNMLHITHEAVMPNPGPLEDQHQPCQPSATSDLLGKKKTVRAYMERIEACIDDENDPNVLDRILALLVQADAAIQTSATPQLKTFQKKDKFSPAQKNETQLRFKKTTGSPGRKKQDATMIKPTEQQKRTLWSSMREEAGDESQPCVIQAPGHDSPESENQSQTPPVCEKPPAGQRKRSRCGSCAGCQRQDCRECRFCLDMVRYGGPGKKKKACVLRNCTGLK